MNELLQRKAEKIREIISKIGNGQLEDGHLHELFSINNDILRKYRAEMESMYQQLNEETLRRVETANEFGIEGDIIRNRNTPNYDGDEPYEVAFVEAPKYENAPKKREFIKYEDLEHYRELVSKYNTENKVANQFVSPYLSGKHNIATLNSGLQKDLERLENMGISITKPEPEPQPQPEPQPEPTPTITEEELQKNINDYIEARNMITQLMKERPHYSREQFNETYKSLKEQLEEIKRKLNPEGLEDSPNLRRAEEEYVAQFRREPVRSIPNQQKSISEMNLNELKTLLEQKNDELRILSEEITNRDNYERRDKLISMYNWLIEEINELEKEIANKNNHKNSIVSSKDPADMTDEEIKAEIEQLIKMDRDAREHLTAEQVNQIRRREEALEDELNKREQARKTPDPGKTPEPALEWKVEKRSVWQWIKDNKKKILIVAGLAAIAVAVVVALQGLMPAIMASMEANNVSTMCQAMFSNGAKWFSAIGSEKTALHGANTALASMIETMTGNKAVFDVGTGIWSFGQSGVELGAFAQEAALAAAKAAKKVTTLSRTAGLLGLGGLGSIGTGVLLQNRSSAYKEHIESIKGCKEYVKRGNISNSFDEDLKNLASQIMNDNRLSREEMQKLLRKLTKVANNADQIKKNSQEQIEEVIAEEVDYDEELTQGRRSR